jgi:hypothetical protein
LFRLPARTEKVSHASALAFQVLFGSNCSFTCSFGKGEPALQKDFESLTPSTVRDPERWDQARNPSAKIKEMNSGEESG